MIDVTKMSNFFNNLGKKQKGYQLHDRRLEEGVAVFNPTEDTYEGYPQKFYKGRKTTLPMIPKREAEREKKDYEENQKYKDTYSKMERMG